MNKKFIKKSKIKIALIVLFVLFFSINIHSVAFADNKDKMLRSIDKTEFLIPVTNSKKSEIISQIKKIYLAIIGLYPELSNSNVAHFQIKKYFEENSGGLQGGAADPNPNGDGICYVEIGIDEFKSGSEPSPSSKNVVFHELLHCWSGLLDIHKGGYHTINSNGDLGLTYGYLEETSVWPIAQGFAKEPDFEVHSANFYNTLTDIFKKRGDQGDNLRILLAARLEGPDAFNKRLDFLNVPAGYASAIAYLEKLLKEGGYKFEKATAWIKSKTPTPADYKTYDFNNPASAAASTNNATDILTIESAGKKQNCPASPPSSGPSAGRDYQSEIFNKLGG
ncbi:hypothetical protein COT77_01515 [Candidatus Berkelbacteria bacterium CG10_big_fil_rev_8_21_14_0_10_41_12]|uniref:Uncharacterized protein n=1 Tax=Candidatus Berkelbacteria bacterium CG10_big_fil_rev_8_21_14_0_10_41_12 TaxID=1974513 RepID=A0A2M6WX90_9BACT|nr:MAG: hypothetical protein COT77_01515 [Candidatus Berkelbacteria bacterium CG10_big_fil_rev_8_21_14_0_10_41_12]